MRAKRMSDLLKKGDRIAVSNITGREASKVCYMSQVYCDNIVGGWALGKGGQALSIPHRNNIPVFGQFEELINSLSKDAQPNKVIVYSPPDAVYGDVKEVIEYGLKTVETIFVITENVSIEVTAKLRCLGEAENIDIIGCNTLGMINAHAGVRIGAVGGDSPEENFLPGGACIISNSGNMVNTIATYLQSAGLGISYAVSTGKDPLILTPLRDLLELAEKDADTHVIVLYVEPGGVYEKIALEWMTERKFRKPILVYIAGEFAEGRNISLGHAGAVVEGAETTASAKKTLFDAYLDAPLFDVNQAKELTALLRKKKKGLRVNTLHDLVPAATTLMTALGIHRDFSPKRPLKLKPWIVGLNSLTKQIPDELVLHASPVAEPYGSLIKKVIKSSLGHQPARQPMRNTSHASSNDGATPRIYGHSALNMMREGSFAKSTLTYWLGQQPQHTFEVKLFDMCLTASLTNGPGTISAQGAKLSASAGNEPNTAMMATLSSIGSVHGGNGKRAARMLIDIFSRTELVNPYEKKNTLKLDKLAQRYVRDFKKRKMAAKEAGIDYQRIPCLGHPVFNKEEVNYDPRERVIHDWMNEQGLYNIFLNFYHRLAQELMTQRVATKIHAVNVDAAITCVLMAIAWPLLVEKKITIERALDLPFIAFALGRTAGGVGEYLDHRECGTAMDMRVPVSECEYLGREFD